jgi:hypothetical protein
VFGHVGECLLDDPVDGEFLALGKRRHRADHGQLDRHPGVADTIDQFADVGDGRGGSELGAPVAPKDAEDPA